MKSLLTIYKRAYQSKYLIIVSTLAILFMVADVAIALAIPRITKNIFVEISDGNNNLDYVIRIGIMVVIIALSAVITTILNNIFAQKLSTKIARDLRSELFEKVQELSFSNIDSISSGTLMTVISNDTIHIQQVIMMMFRIVLRSPLTLIGAIIMAYITNGKLFPIIIGAVLILGISIMIIFKRASKAFMLLQDRIDDLNSRLLETVSGAREIKSFVTENDELERFNVVNDNYNDSIIYANKRIALIDPLIILISNLAIGSVLLMSSYMVFKDFENRGEVIGSITAYISYLQQIIMSLMMLSMVAINLSRSSVSANRIMNILTTNIDVANTNNPEYDFFLKGRIEFRNVSFGYVDEESATKGHTLNNLSFLIEANSVVGIIGSTGSGKTSLVQLLPRLYDVTEGELLLDNINVKDLDLKTLRKQISYVTQEPIIFSGTIASNVRQGKNDASDEEVINACRKAALSEFIEGNEEGINSVVNQGGSNLSGGQRQRLAIARAIIRNPKILILDDSTSAVDAKSEMLIKNNLKEVDSQTTLIVAQKISSIKNCDYIIVLDNTGNLDGFASHKDLLKTSKVYQEIYISQFGGLDNE